MSILIVEEALRDRKAHWFSYIRTIARAGVAINVTVDVAGNVNADAEILNSFRTFPIFSHSVYLDQHRRKLPGERFYSLILHSFRILKVLWPLLKKRERYNEALVPTMLVQHLLAWWFIVTFHPKRPKRVTLFFVATPGVWNESLGRSVMPKSSQLMKFLLRLFRNKNNVRFGVETKSALKEYESLTGLKFTLFPHPVDFDSSPIPISDKSILNFCCYGFARHEKGSDLLAEAIARITSSGSIPQVHFRIQWLDPFRMPDGTECGPGKLKNNDRVTVITRALDENEYLELLKDTDCMLLPYRNSSYHSRLSRVAIEAAFMGIPMVYTKGGWLDEIATEHGAGVGMKGESIEDLVESIKKSALNINDLKSKAAARSQLARDYYSGERFINILIQ
ncbi:MAG TPA: glycosyltransferase [Cyclobacteriaceae bacterium]|nr:glycosyltransferase [Cyclobacteriaceae bacterium]